MRSSGTVIVIAFIIFLLMLSAFQGEIESDGQETGSTQVNPYVSFRFLRSSQNIEENRLFSLDDIFYYVSVYNLTATPLDQNIIGLLIERVQGYQNKDGGFGDWYNDRSKAGSTQRALEILKMLGSAPLNRSGVSSFLERLQVSGLLYGNFGFRSSLKERDADISSTYNGIRGIIDLETPVPNRTGVEFYVEDHQNFDGGFGYQTNRGSGIFWDSTMVHTHRGILSAGLLEKELTFPEKAYDFIISNQESTGGFSNTPGTGARVSYTYNAVSALLELGRQIPRQQDITSFILSNQLDNGGFIEYTLDTKEGLHTTYFAVRTLMDLGAEFDKDLVVSFVEWKISQMIDGGFGDYPGLGSNSRITFDAVSALNRIGRVPVDRDAAAAFVEGYRNADGGYGDSSISNVETTYRSILTLNLLEEPLEDPLDTISYLRKIQNNDGGFGFSSGYISRGSYTYRAIRALDILGREPFDKQGSITYLRSLQNPDGGFGNYFGEEDSDITSTYRAVRGLSILGSEPLNRQGAVDFLMGSLNEDGGFKRSPGDLTSPGNYSTSLYTYNAVLSLDILGEDLDRQLTEDFVISLRNPDLGFGEKEFFTSTVADTFTSLWSLMVLGKEILDKDPVIGNLSYPENVVLVSDHANVSVRIHDPEGQIPEYVHLIVDGTRTLMRPLGSMEYTASIQLPPGDHMFSIEVSDGINKVKENGFSLTFVEEIGAPKVSLSVSPEEGLDDTEFIITAELQGTNDVIGVQLLIDDNEWKEMEWTDTDRYEFRTLLHSGIHIIRARADTGSSYGYSDKVVGPIVHTRNSTRPDWNIFLKIRDLMDRENGISINYTDVSREIISGRIAWKVSVSGDEYHVTYDGTGFVDEDEDENIPLWPFVLLFVSIVLLVMVTVLIIRNRKRMLSGLFGDDAK